MINPQSTQSQVYTCHHVIEKYSMVNPQSTQSQVYTCHHVIDKYSMVNPQSTQSQVKLTSWYLPLCNWQVLYDQSPINSFPSKINKFTPATM